MLAEHIFITTLDAPDAFATADKASAQLGFNPGQNDNARRAEWARGPKKPGYRSMKKLPMRLRMDFDRGKVTLALAIDEVRTKPDPRIAAYGLAVLSSFEAALARTPAPDALAPAQAAEHALRRHYFWQNFWIWAVLAVFLGLPVLAIVAAAVIGAMTR